MKYHLPHIFLLVATFLGQTIEWAEAKGKAEHVVVVVWDGMRPDFITPQYTPTLYSLATNGVFFKKHHPAYVSSTEVNGASLATGAHPDRTGIMANTDYRPDIGWLGPQATEGLEAVRRGDLLTGGNYLLVPTIAEIIQGAGFPTITAGTKQVVLLHDRSNRKTSAAGSNSVTFYKGNTIPRSALEGMRKVNDDKAFPTNTTHPNTTADAWTTKGLTHYLWRKGVPKYTLLWLSEPDASQHETGPGSDVSIQALASSDKNLSEVVKALDEKKVLDKTDIFVVSDHGFSTIAKGPDVTEALKRAKFKATKKHEDPEPGDILVVGLGGSISFYVFDRVEEVIQRLVSYLQNSDFAGVIFSRIPIEGTFPLERVRIGNSRGSPDVLVSTRWNHDKSQYGTPGMFVSEGGTRNKGSHASLSAYDMRNTLVASGPDFKRGYINTLPSGNIDVAPTILHILGIPQPSSSPMDGRVLKEALVGGVPDAVPQQKTIEATRDHPLFQWKQYLKFTEFGGAVYFDEGNGEPAPK